MGWLAFVFTSTVALVGLLVAYVAWQYNYFKNELKEKDPTYRADFAEALTDHSWLRRYRNTLQRALDWLDRWMGAPSSLRALGVCVTMSLVYALAFFLGSWTFGGPGTVGSTELLPQLAFWQQALWGGLALFYLSTMAWMAYRQERIERTIFDWLSRRLRPRFGARAKAAARWLYRLGGAAAAAIILLAATFYVGFETGTGPVALAVAGGGAVAGAGTVAVAVALALTVAGAVVLAGSGAVAFAVTIAVAVAGAVALAGALDVAAHRGIGAQSGPEALAGTFFAVIVVGIVIISGDIAGLDSIIFLLFFVALPMVNAILDWPSWCISRWLGQHLSMSIQSHRSLRYRFGIIIVHTLTDFGAAIVLLYLLAMALPFVIELFNLGCAAHDLGQPLELRGFLNGAVNSPWPDGLWVLAMLLSTLVPTVLHAMALVASPVMVWLGPNEKRERVAMALREEAPEPWAIREASWHKVWTWLIALVVPLAMLGLFVGAIGLIWRPVGDILLSAAFRGMAGAFHVAHWVGWIVP